MFLPPELHVHATVQNLVCRDFHIWQEKGEGAEIQAVSEFMDGVNHSTNQGRKEGGRRGKVSMPP